MYVDYKTYCDPDTATDIQVKEVFVEETLRLKCYQDVVILPSCNTILPNCDGEIVMSDGSIINDVNPNVNYPLISLEKTLSIPENLPEEHNVIYLGTITKCWGHYFTDGLSKLYFFFTDEWKALKEKENIKILFVSPYNTVNKAPKPWLDLLYILFNGEMTIVPEPINNLKKYRKVYVPDNSLHMLDKHRVYTKEYNDTINTLLSRINPNKKYEKIYLSRKHWIDKNADFGESNIEKLFNKVGYRSISPEKYSIKEQLEIFKSAKSVVSTSGSLAHNVIFCNNGIEFICLRKCTGSQDYQMMINHLKQHNTTLIDCHLTLFVDENVALGPFFMYVNDNVVRFFKDRFGIVVKKNFSPKQYMRYAKICFCRENFYRRHRPYNEYTDYYYIKLSNEFRDYKNIKRKIFDLLNKGGFNNITRLLKKLYYRVTR